VLAVQVVIALGVAAGARGLPGWRRQPAATAAATG
jgi:hypothetical protein